MLPEEFPVILTVFPALGAWRLARSQVLTRRLAAIEILGSTSVLCVDKTGTLTENRMAVARLWRDGVEHEAADGVPAPPQRELLACALRVSRPPGSDPMEAALWRLAGAALDERGAVPVGWRLVHEYGLTPQRRALVHVWDRGDGGALAAFKGAPETVAAMCRPAQEDPALGVALAAAARMAADGLRVLAVARAHLAAAATAWPEDPAQLRPELLGLVALADPLWPDIPAAMAACRGAGRGGAQDDGGAAAGDAELAHQAGYGRGGGADHRQFGCARQFGHAGPGLAPVHLRVAPVDGPQRASVSAGGQVAPDGRADAARAVGSADHSHRGGSGQVLEVADAHRWSCRWRVPVQPSEARQQIV